MDTIEMAFLVSGGCVFISLISVALIEKVMPINPKWSGIKKDSMSDLASFVTVVAGVEGFLKWLFPILIIYIHQVVPVTSIFNIHVGMNNLFLETVIGIFLIELIRYWFHRISHENFFLWKIHSAHHCPTRMYWGNSYRLNPIYHLIVSFLSIFPFLIIGLDPMVLIIYNTMLGITANFQHANIILNHGWLSKVFSTSEIHKWHHSVDLRESMKNYGALLSIFDVIFGTFYNPKGRIPHELGLTDEPWYPKDSYMKQVLTPFFWKKWKKNHTLIK